MSERAAWTDRSGSFSASATPRGRSRWRKALLPILAVITFAAIALVAFSHNLGSPAQTSTEPTDTSVVVVPATANIFGAGQDTAPDPGGGGGGSVPPVWPLPSGATRVVTFPSLTGEVNPIVHVESVGYNGPGGDMTSDTDVESFGGISGIIHRGNGMFLVGVFLTDDPPAGPAPARLDFTDDEEFDPLEPEIGQTFFIGAGVGRRFLVPAGATRLFLGFVNGYTPGDPLRLSHGEPGYYANNAGELEVEVEVSAVE